MSPNSFVVCGVTASITNKLLATDILICKMPFKAQRVSGLSEIGNQFYLYK